MGMVWGIWEIDGVLRLGMMLEDIPMKFPDLIRFDCWRMSLSDK